MSLTIILTTSPIKSHPSTTVIDLVIDSVNKHLSSENKIKIIIVCDGYKTKKSNQKSNYKSAIINDIEVDNYKQYIQNIKSKYHDHNIDIIVRDKNYGFAKNIFHVMKTFVQTKYVMILQHDWIFISNLNIDKMINLMEQNREIFYLNFQSSTTIDYINKMQNNYYNKILTEDYITKCGTKLLKLPFWYDKPHICQTSHYVNHVFGKKHYDPYIEKYIPIKKFVEDTYGQVILNDIKINGISAHEKYGTFLYNKSNQPLLMHINGRTFMTIKMLDQVINS